MTSDQEILYSIALSKIKGISLINANQLYQAMGDATSVFANRNDIRSYVPEASQRVVDIFKDVDYAIREAERELQFMEGKSVRCLTQKDADYPRRLRNCTDAPIALYYCGNANLNNVKVISMVGTRKITPYGAGLCKEFVADLKRICPDVLIVSGLAYGVDIHCHRAALDNDMETVGVLAHGLDRIYPYQHRATAVEMTRHGGLLTEYTSGTQPERYNFISRNRIVAGMCDHCIVVESAEKGGSLITADLANGYEREVHAFPGRTTDLYSAGCNKLIQQQKARPIHNAQEFANWCGWSSQHTDRTQPLQQELFVQLSAEEQAIVKALEGTDTRHINEIVNATGMSSFSISATLFDMEMKGLVSAYGGGRYKLSDTIIQGRNAII